MRNKLDIFGVLQNIDAQNYQFVETLSTDDIKQLHPFVIIKWLSSSRHPLQIVLLNEVLNPYVFSCSNHKKLLYKLCCVSTNGKIQRYKWNKSKTSETNKEKYKILKEYYGYSTKQCKDVVNLLDTDDYIEMLEKLGYQPNDIKKIRKSL